MIDRKMKPFCCTFNCDGSQWGFEIYADDWADAERRLTRLKQSAKIDGELHDKIPAAVGWWVPAWVWFLNWRDRRKT